MNKVKDIKKLEEKEKDIWRDKIYTRKGDTKMIINNKKKLL